MTTPLPAPLAERATTATGRTGPCAVCQRQILTGERYAVLVPADKFAHLPCIALAATRARRAVPVIR